MYANPEIVLVEDDGSVRQAIERVLRGSGYQVATFDSAESLQQRLDGAVLRESCRCLVCDVQLPGVSGFELHRQLSQQGPIPPWIFITAHDDPALRRQAEREGAVYLPKPFRGRALLALIAQATAARGS